jgi:hypothetical protein
VKNISKERRGEEKIENLSEEDDDDDGFEDFFLEFRET